MGHWGTESQELDRTDWKLLAGRTGCKLLTAAGPEVNVNVYLRFLPLVGSGGALRVVFCVSGGHVTRICPRD